MVVQGTDLYAGGYFSHAGKTETQQIARWDGRRWHSLGTGVNREVFALTVYKDNLYVGGTFSLAGDVPTNGSARWNSHRDPGTNTGGSREEQPALSTGDRTLVGVRFRRL